jgi:uncharacterized protein YecT (DUF1311 family)
VTAAPAGWLAGAALVLAASGPSHAQDADGPRFDPGATEACLAAAADLAAREACIGRSAEGCIDSDAGATTVGMGFCLGGELEWWDARLNAAYRALLARERAVDAEMAEIGATVPSLADALQAMQRAWIGYRDATCDYERAQWGNGTGAGPAAAACLMTQTGEQALYIENREAQLAAQ